MDMHTHAHVQVCTHLSAPEHKHRQIRVHTYLHTHTCKQLCTQPFAFPCVHSTRKYTHAHLCTSTGVQTCTYPQVQSPISTHTHKHTLPMHIHNRTHAHTCRHTLHTSAGTGAGRHMCIIQMCTSNAWAQWAPGDRSTPHPGDPFGQVGAKWHPEVSRAGTMPSSMPFIITCLNESTPHA